MIERFQLEGQVAQNWKLHEFKMDRLGRFVVLAGRNGAGKSRILDAMTWVASDGRWSAKFFAPQPKGRLQLIDILPRAPALHDAYDNREQEQQHALSATVNLGSASIAQQSISYAQSLFQTFWNTSHQANTQVSDEDRNAAKAKWDGFQQLAAELLHARLGHQAQTQRLTLFGEPIARAKLSHGQTLLFQVAVILHAQGGGLRDRVLLLDEPENHLHPSAVTDFVDRVSNVCDAAQLWIATHSVPLLSWLHSRQPGCLWFVDDGRVTHAGRTPERVLESLLGDPEQIERLRHFVALPAQLAQVNFAAQCLLPPGISANGADDPQVAQIAAVLDSIRKDRPPRVLDYGAGTGRLLDGLAHEMGTEVSARIDYYAFDKFPQGRPESEALLTQIYGATAPGRYFETRDELAGRTDRNSFDLVVLCNVLHEVPIGEWHELFGQDGLCHGALKTDGWLLVVEDQQIPIGERAHNHGFLVFDEVQLARLFDVHEEDRRNGLFLSCASQRNGRLKAHLINAQLVQRFTNDRKREALAELERSARESIKRLRASEPSYRNGQALAFWTQQFANASLALKEVE